MEMVGSHTEKTARKHNLSALSWNPQGKRGRARLKNTRRRELETKIKRTGISWKDLDKMTLDKKAWRDMVADPCLHGGYRAKKKNIGYYILRHQP
jgi:hypothetical protein